MAMICVCQGADDDLCARRPRQAYLTDCSPKQFSSLDMSLCYDCCSYSCQTGADIPTWEGTEVLLGCEILL